MATKIKLKALDMKRSKRLPWVSDIEEWKSKLVVVEVAGMQTIK